MQGLQGAMHGGEQHRLQASQQVFQDMGNPAMKPQLHEAVLADSLYRSVTERLQSGAGPASFNQVSNITQSYSALAGSSLLSPAQHGQGDRDTAMQPQMPYPSASRREA